MSEPILAPEEAEELFEGEGVVGEWAWVTGERLDSGRWDQHHRMILRHIPTGAFYGLDYSTGLTENQPNSFPWVKDMWTNRYGEMGLTRLYPHRVLTTVYKTTPPITWKDDDEE